MRKEMRFPIVPVFAVLFFLAFPVAASEEDPGLSPAEVLARLKDGNDLFVDGFRRLHGDVVELRRRLAQDGQKPIAAVVACSDSREPVEFIFDQPLGGLFVIRTAGNTADVQSLGSVGYAVGHLRVPVVVVLGHTGCGAVKAVLSGEPAEGSLARMLEPIAAAAERLTAEGRGKTSARDLEVANVRQAVESFIKEDATFAEKIENGGLLVVGALYDIETGGIDWF